MFLKARRNMFFFFPWPNLSCNFWISSFVRIKTWIFPFFPAEIMNLFLFLFLREKEMGTLFSPTHNVVAAASKTRNKDCTTTTNERRILSFFPPRRPISPTFSFFSQHFPFFPPSSLSLELHFPTFIFCPFSLQCQKSLFPTFFSFSLC